MNNIDVGTIADETEELALTDIEQEDLDAVDADAKSINYSGQDFDVDGLVRRLDKRDIVIPTFGHDDETIQAEGFQRAFVWRRPQMDKFIESILLGYPIPGIFLVKQLDNRYLVLDGQQRLLTLQFFKEGIYESKEFSLNNVADEFKNLTYKRLTPEQRRTFDNTFIQAIIVTSDGSADSLESIYKIFERLNSGGTQLTPHEIRIALFAGPFIGFLEELNKNADWRSLYGKKSPRLRDQELVLRIVGLFLEAKNYRKPLKKFLNTVVSAYRENSAKNLVEVKNVFESATAILAANNGREHFRLSGVQLNAALTEVVMVGLMTHIKANPAQINGAQIGDVVENLKRDRTFKEAVTRSTADESQVTYRLERAIQAFKEC